MQVKAHFESRQAFVLTPEHIKKIWDIFATEKLKIEASAKCSDGIVRNFETCQELIEYENPKRSAITSLEISGHSLKPYSTSKVSFAERFSASIQVSIGGEESYVTEAKTKIADIIDDTKAWYSWLSIFDLFYFWMSIAFLAFSIFNLTTSSGGASKALSMKTAILVLAIIISIVGIAVLVIWGMSWIKNRFFPVSTFSIGQGHTRHLHAEQVRWVVIIGFAISVVSSIVTTLAMST